MRRKYGLGSTFEVIKIEINYYDVNPYYNDPYMKKCPECMKYMMIDCGEPMAWVCECGHWEGKKE